MKQWTRVPSPIGDLILVAEAGALREIRFTAGTRPEGPPDDAHEDPRPFERVAAQLREYFEGVRREFDVPLAPQGTPFQRRVWDALLGVGYGRTATYADVARAIGHPKSVRAVGLANGRNPIPIIIPCHRIIGSDGSLTGYGGGLAIKRALLELEGALPVGTPELFG
ncbi:MAG TPA: methylated-DNA--[protein]-cysteine S-methyltransferase [Gammaproteobacteria bacterium]